MYNEKDIWDDIELMSKPESLDEEMFELISAYADGECTPKERRLVEAYLAGNLLGQKVLNDLRAQRPMLSEPAAPPAWLSASILEQTVGTAQPVRWAPTLRLGLPLATAAAICAFWLTRPHSSAIAPAQDTLSFRESKPDEIVRVPAKTGNSAKQVLPSSTTYAENTPAEGLSTGAKSDQRAILNASQEVPPTTTSAPTGGPKAAANDAASPAANAGNGTSSGVTGGGEKKPIATPNVVIPMPDPKRPDTVASQDGDSDSGKSVSKQKNDDSGESIEALRKALREHNESRTDIKEGAKGEK